MLDSPWGRAPKVSYGLSKRSTSVRSSHSDRWPAGARRRRCAARPRLAQTSWSAGPCGACLRCRPLRPHHDRAAGGRAELARPGDTHIERSRSRRAGCSAVAPSVHTGCVSAPGGAGDMYWRGRERARGLACHHEDVRSVVRSDDCREVLGPVAVVGHEVRRGRGERQQRAVVGERRRGGSRRRLFEVDVFGFTWLAPVGLFARFAAEALRDPGQGAVCRGPRRTARRDLVPRPEG